MTPSDEEKLVRLIREDRRQFGVVFDGYYVRIFQYVLKRTGEYNIACDVTAETFLKAFLRVQKFEWRGVSISAWLYRIATNEVNGYFRKQKYQPKLLARIKDFHDFEFNTSIEDERAAIEKEMDDLIAFREIQQHLKKLDIKYQEVIALRFFENKSNTEISEILRKPEGTVKSLLSRGLEKLRKDFMNRATISEH